jgi:hypothetical protein
MAREISRASDVKQKWRNCILADMSTNTKEIYGDLVEVDKTLMADTTKHIIISTVQEAVMEKLEVRKYIFMELGCLRKR